MREYPEQFFEPSSEESSAAQEKSKQAKARLIARYIKTRVVGKNESLTVKEEKDLQEYYENMSPREKADVLYGKMMAYMVDKKAQKAKEEEAKEQGEQFESTEIDPYLISEIKILSSDKAVQALLPETYGEARIDEREIKFSEVSNLWKGLKKEIQEKEQKYEELERKMYLGQISGRGNISSAKSRLSLLADNLLKLRERVKDIETLQGFEKTSENTDTAARFQYEQLKEYQEQLEKGFVWLPSRKAIHQETIHAILNHRWPVLIGEAGSGKSDQADAAALELTGYEPTKIACSSKTGEKDMLFDKDIDPATGGSFEAYKPLMQALTGYENSLQEKPGFDVGRIARLDEAYRLPHDSSGYSILKEVRQLKPDDTFHGKKVLPGTSAIWTTNPPGPRYPGRYSPDAAMRREVAEIEVKYPEMNIQEPEFFDFALAALLDENSHISVAKQELAPAYQKVDIPEDQREVLSDGSIVIAKDEIIADMSDRRHSALWRFCAAIKALQESFVYGNAETEKYPDDLLRYKEDAEGNIEIATDGSGDPLILSSSTVTLGELASWVSGFNSRMEKRDQEFHVDTLTDWLNLKIKIYIRQADSADKEKLKAIFRHFCFLENTITPDIETAKPLTPKEIGYLSPRTPRPVYLEKPIQKSKKKIVHEKPLELKEYETNDVLLEDGTRILIQDKELVIGDEVVAPGKKFRIKNQDFYLAGVVADANHQYNGQPLGKFSGEELYRIFEATEVDFGILTYFKEVELGATGVDDFKQELIDTWSDEGCLAEKGSFNF